MPRYMLKLSYRSDCPQMQVSWHREYFWSGPWTLFAPDTYDVQLQLDLLNIWNASFLGTSFLGSQNLTILSRHQSREPLGTLLYKALQTVLLHILLTD